MSLRTALLSVAAIFFLSIGIRAQVRTIGGGCASNSSAPKVEGSLMLGSRMELRTGCITSPGSSRFMLFGVEMPQPTWVPILLETGIGQVETCTVSVMPAIVVADFSSQPEPIVINIPNDPIWSGFPLALQSYCIQCGFAGCFATLGEGVVATIQ